METIAVTKCPAQAWDADGYARNARFVAELGAPLVALLAPRSGERVLDVGCGDGYLTQQIAAKATVIAIDASPEMVAAARARGIDARVADGEKLDFRGEFDGVFSNAALHWMKRADDVVDGMYRALKPGGRLVVEFGGHGCVAKIREGIEQVLRDHGVDASEHCPWYFPERDRYVAKLEARGFVVEDALLFDRPTPLPNGVAGWLSTFAGPYLAALPEAERARAAERIEARLTPRLRDETGVVIADYVRLRVVARRPRRAPLR